jgi:hypothetical protein
MMRRSLGRIAQLAKASLAQQSASIEIISSSQLIGSNQAALSLASSSNWINLYSWRLYSSETSGDGGPPSKNTPPQQSGGGDSPMPLPTAAVSSPLETDAALDAWGDAMDKGWFI